MIKGGEFLIKDQQSQDVFIPEDFSEEQFMMASATKEFAEKELEPNGESRVLTVVGNPNSSFSLDTFSRNWFITCNFLFSSSTCSKDSMRSDLALRESGIEAKKPIGMLTKAPKGINRSCAYPLIFEEDS